MHVILEHIRIFLVFCCCGSVAKSCLTPCDPVDVPLLGQHHILLLSLFVLFHLRWVKRRPVQYFMLIKTHVLFPPPFSKTVYCSVGVSVVQKVERKKKDLILVYLSAASDFSEMRNHPRASVFRSVIWALLKACPRSGSPRSVLSGNALGDHARGSGPSKECRLGG